MGTSKQLLQLGNKAVIRLCVDAIEAAGIGNIVVVCGAEHGACAKELAGTGALLVRNEAKQSQMVDSVRIGLRAVDSSCTGVFVCLADHPLVSKSTYRTMVDAHQRSPEKIIIPAFKGRRGHPSLFPFTIINGIFTQPTLRDLIKKESEHVLILDLPDEGVILDMDTPEDYRAVAERSTLFA
jgi:molybdenum cofactor cytidylyltransferase